MWFSFIIPILVLTISAILIFLIILKAPLNYRLTQYVKPLSYDILIQPYLLAADGVKQFSFEGEVNITLQATKDFVKQIAVHKNDINIKDVIIYNNFQKQIQNFRAKELMYVSKTHQLFINLLKPLESAENYTLYIKYSGKIRNYSYGLFGFSYDNISWQALTLLQPLGARLVLPCFDEPEFKSKFKMNLIRPRNYRSFFNTKLLTTVKVDSNHEMDTFDYTPLMSSYLLAFMINDYVSYGDNDVQMIAPIEMINETYFSYEVFRKSLKFCDSFFPMTYKQLGNSLIQISLTNNYKYLAVENWGLIVFRDSVIQQIPNYTDGLINKQKSIGTIIHELVHMWFGNSVTVKWWNHFWLNEAFARYYEVIIGDMLYPLYEFEQQFVINKMHLILDIDAKSDSQTLSSPEKYINTPSEIASKLNRITYEKGAAVLRMFSNAMGRHNFNMAMRDYLKENHLKNTQPHVVFKHLSNYWPKDHQMNLKEFFQDWTEQSGYPMIIITTTERGKYILKQKRFLSNNKSSSTLTYTIPITYTTDMEKNFENLTPKFYFNRTLSKLIFGNVKRDKWLILNLQQSNFCRVLYDARLLERLREAFMSYNHSGIHVINRASLIDDLFTFAHEGLVGYKKVFYFMEYLAQETEYLPWKAAFKGFEIVCQRFNDQQHKKFALYLFKPLDHVYRKLDFMNSNNSILVIYNSKQIIQWLCKYHHDDCNSRAQEIFRFHLLTNTKPSTDIRETLYCAASRYGNFEVYGNLMQMFQNTKLLSEQETILRSLACTRYNVKILFKFLLSNNVSLNLKKIGFSSLFSQTFENIDPVLELIQKNIEELAKALQGWPLTASIISDIANYLTTEQQLIVLKDFVKNKGYLFGKSVKILRSCIRNVENNLNWSNKYLGKLFN